MTYGEFIRNLTDEELAELLAKIEVEGLTSKVRIINTPYAKEEAIASKKRINIELLASEVEE